MHSIKQWHCSCKITWYETAATKYVPGSLAAVKLQSLLLTQCLVHMFNVKRPQELFCQYLWNIVYTMITLYIK